MSKKFELNECNVVLNPNTVWKYEPENYLAWCYWEIKTGVCKNNLWDFGYSTAGGGSPVCIGKYKTESQAIDEAIQYFSNHFNKGFTSGMYKEKYFIKAKESFNLFLNKRLFENQNSTIGDMETVLDDGTNYFQGSLF